MKLLISFQCTYILSLLIVTAQANAITPQQSQTLIQASGLSHQIKQISQHLYDSLSDQPETDVVDHTFLGQYEALLATYFSAEPLLDIIQTEIAQTVDDKTYQQAYQWFQSDLGQRITQREIAASNANNLRQFETEGKELKSLVNQQRLELIERIDSAVNATDFAVDMAINLQTAILKAMSQDPLSHTNHFHLKGTIGEQVFINLLATYQTLSDQELQQMIHFLESQAGQAFHNATRRAINLALVGQSQEFGSALAELLQAHAIPKAQ